MSEWREVRLGDLCEHVTVGHVGKMSDQYIDNGVPFLRSQDVTPFSLNIVGCRRVSVEFHHRLKKSALRPGDLVIVRTGYPGTAAVVPDGVGEMNCADLVVIRPRPELDPWFLAAYFNSTHGQSLVGGKLVGSAQQHFNVQVASDVRILLPPLEQQYRIARIIRSLTELIDINEGRIKLLEDRARSLYREWFVRFRFPGHEFVESEAGQIPVGWHVVPLGSLAELVSRGVEAATIDPANAYVGLEHLPRRSTTLREWGSAADVTSRKLRFDRGDVLFGKIRPYFHKVVWAPVDGVASSDTIILRAVPGYRSLVCAVTSSDEFIGHSVATSNGTKMPRADWKVLKEYPVAVAPEGHRLLEQFEAVVGSSLEFCAHLAAQNRTIVSTRDLLLPRLVTGRLDISDVDLGKLLPREPA